MASSWWKNIVALDKVIPDKKWLVESVFRKVGNGASTSFWHSKWVGEALLAVVYPRLYSLSNHKENNVADFLVGDGESREWAFTWRRRLFQWEEELAALLVESLGSVVFSMDEDRWIWLINPDETFSVKSTYIFLAEELRRTEDIDEDLRRVLNQIWESTTPSKVIAFSWQLLLDRIPTRNNLEGRGIVMVEEPWECVGCVGSVETSSHLFLLCPSALKVWREIFYWVGVDMAFSPSLGALFEDFKASARNAKLRRGYVLIWHVTLWSIWKARNSAIFANGFFNPNGIIDDIKLLSWKWGLIRLKLSPCMLYEWLWNPGDCLLR
jgi:hypothetical protein